MARSGCRRDARTAHAHLVSSGALPVRELARPAGALDGAEPADVDAVDHALRHDPTRQRPTLRIEDRSVATTLS
jgi:hypothetical protein